MRLSPHKLKTPCSQCNHYWSIDGECTNPPFELWSTISNKPVSWFCSVARTKHADADGECSGFTPEKHGRGGETAVMEMICSEEELHV